MQTNLYRYAAKLAAQNVQARRAQTILTALVVGIAVALAVNIVVLADAAQRGITRAADAFGVLVIGPKGSTQQLVMNSILLQDSPIGLIDTRIYEELQTRTPNLLVAPLAFGDNVARFPIIGTTEAFFQLRRSFNEPPVFQTAAGRFFQEEHEAVLGAEAARILGLTLGDQFVASHGIMRGLESDQHEEHPYTVVGILGRTYSPYDRGVFTDLESVWETHDLGVDDAFVGRPRADTQTSVRGKVTAALVLPFGITLNDIYRIAQEVNNSPDAQAAFPGAELGELFGLLSQGQTVLNGVAVVALIMASLTVLLSLYSTTLARQGAIAVMRSLGASRAAIFAMTLFEAAWISLVGVVIGAVLGHLSAAVLGRLLAEQSAIPIETRILWAVEVPMLLVPVVLGVIAGILPAIMAYRVNVVAHLSA